MKPIFPLVFVFLGFALFPFFSVAIPHENEVEKSKKVSYPANAETLLQLKNQFGQIYIEPGPKRRFLFVLISALGLIAKKKQIQF